MILYIEDSNLCAFPKTWFFKYYTDIIADGTLTKEKQFGYFLVGQTVRYLYKDLVLTDLQLYVHIATICQS